MTKTRTRMFTYLDGSGHESDEVGGKAAGLDQLIAFGFPVPPAAVLTTEAYRRSVSAQGLSLLTSDLRTSALPVPELIAAESAAIERAFLSAEIPDAVTAAIDRISTELLPNGPVAVRSSATAEDLRSASFAGQYLTVTHIVDRDGLETAIRRCWASLWLPAARAYRRNRHISEHHIAMGVIVQTMVDPLWSGVVFTSDPDGASHLIRVEAVAGLGEALVSGRVTPYDYTIRKDTLEVAASSGSPQLEFLEDLGRIAVGLEAAGHGPQDIEWAFTDTGLALLQMRPITTTLTTTMASDGLDTHPAADAVYTPHGVIEMLPGVVPPLLWTINAPMLENAFRTTLADLGGHTPGHSKRIVCRFRGRTALNLSALSEIAASMPGGSAAEVERQYLGHALSDDTPTRRALQLIPALRARRAHQRIVDEVELISAAALGLNAIGLDLTELPVRRLVAYRQRIRDLAWRGYAAEVGASSAASATYRALELLLARWMSETDAAAWAQRVTRGALAKSAVGAARAKALIEVLEEHATAEIRAIITGDGGDPRSRIVALDPDGAAFLSALDTTVLAMGSRAIYGDRTWAEDDWWIWRQLELLATSPSAQRPDESDDFEALCRLLTSRRGWKRLRILTGQFVDVRIRWLQRQVDETIRFLELRERAKSALLVLGGEERRIVVEAANRLVGSRLLPDAGEVQMLTDSELDGMLFGRRDPAAIDWSARRDLGQEQIALGPLPDWFSGNPDFDESAPVAAGDRLRGWAASPGVAEGAVRLINSLDEGGRLGKGDILVAHSTDPSWTPLLLTAGAVVLEMGGPLAHAAIVAREFGLPSVLNVPKATRILRDGERVRVDGTHGVVDRLQEGDSP